MSEINFSDELDLDEFTSVRLAPGPYQKPADSSFLDNVVAEIEKEGDKVNPLFLDDIDDERLITGLMDHCDKTVESATDYIVHSSRFSDLASHRFTPGVELLREKVEIPVSDANVHHNGRSRRHEEGRKIDIDYVRSVGIDPSRVLFFRVTQPMGDEPKPEYYWTTDFSETLAGLGVELGEQAKTAIILVATLEDIAKNGGLIADINDDSGLSVRQIGLEPYDQSRALASFNRR